MDLPSGRSIPLSAPAPCCKKGAESVAPGHRSPPILSGEPLKCEDWVACRGGRTALVRVVRGAICGRGPRGGIVFCANPGVGA